MKRRLLSAFLAVMMVLTMAPVAFAADTSATVSTQDELLTALNDASITEITLTNDIALTGVWTPVEIAQGRTLVINGAGNTISNLKVTGGILAPSGSGVAGDGHSCDYYAAFIGVNKGTLTINNLKFTNADVDIKPVTVSLASTGSSMISVVCANNAGDMVYNDVEVQNCVVRGYTKVGLLNGFTSPAKTGSFVANHCAIVNCEVVVEADGTDPEASLNAAIIGYDGYNHAKTNGIKLQNVTCTIDESVKWADGIQTKEDGTKYCGRWGIYSPTYAHDNYDVKTVPMVAEIDGYQYESLADAIAAAEDSDTVTLLKNTVEDVVIPAGKTITLDLNGKKLTNVASHTIFNNGTLTINGEGTVDNVTHGKAALVNYGTAMLNNGVTLKRSSEKGTLVPYNNGGNSYYTILNDKGATMTINNATVENSGGYSSAICNGGDPQCNKESYLTINDGNFSGGINTVKNDGLGILTINGGTFSNSSQYVVMNWHKAEFHGTATFSANAMAEAVLFTSSYDNSPIMAGELKVFDGYYKAATDKQALIRDHYDADNKGTAIISGGYFTTDPSAYCVTGKTGVKSDKDGYKYKVGTIEVKDENEIKIDTQKGATQATLSSEIAEKDKTAATAVGTSVTPTKLTDTTPITADDKAQALTELVKKNKVKLTDDGKIPAGTTVTVVKETYLDVTVTAYDTKSNTVSMDITPKYNLIATTDKDNRTAENSVTLETKPLTVSEATKVSVTIPAFANKKVYIDHANGKNLYVAKADANGKIEFTTNGFSPFTFTLSNPHVVAEVNGNAYKSLQDAANAAKDGDEITVVQNKNLDLAFTTTKSVKVTNKTDNTITVKFNGTNKDVAKDATETFSYTKPSSGGSSGGSSSGKTTYKVTTSAVNNGGVNASPSNAEKGATITITLSPNKGYKLDKLTVTDGSGKSVSTVKKSDTVYTFTMPASAVTVGVSYAKADETPSKTTFNDVSANDWFASAVDYVTGKGMMNGTAANTFSPKANTTRGMLMTVLARHAGEDTTGGSVWYEKGMNWAKANGVSDGTNPQVNITREQLAAMLYRYAQNKKYDVSGAKSLDGYTDAQSVSSYAVPALQWANAAGVVTGKSGSKLDPKGYATRAEVAAMLMRFCENVEK